MWVKVLYRKQAREKMGEKVLLFLKYVSKVLAPNRVTMKHGKDNKQRTNVSKNPHFHTPGRTLLKIQKVAFRPLRATQKYRGITPGSLLSWGV